MKTIFLLMINCYWKMSKMGNVIYFCNALLDIDKENIKALVKRAQAYMFEGELKCAYNDLMKAKKLDPKDGVIEEELKKV